MYCVKRYNLLWNSLVLKPLLFPRMVLNSTEGGTVDVLVTSNRRGAESDVEVKTWTSASSQGNLDLNTSGLIFYVSVTQGNVAVKGLHVTATFYSAKNLATQVVVPLSDDGYGG